MGSITEDSKHRMPPGAIAVITESTSRRTIGASDGVSMGDEKLLRDGDFGGGTAGALLLEGDMQSGTDVLLLEGMTASAGKTVNQQRVPC